ncbi:MAG: hypothetical protein AAFU03_08160, partial [Bacteroidota bacterium]
MAEEHRHTNHLLRRYLRGEVGAREEAELDRRAASDAFLADALEGYRSSTESDHISTTQRLRGQLPRARKQVGYIRYWAAAAALLLVVSVAVLLPINLPNKAASVAMQEEVGNSTIEADEIVQPESSTPPVVMPREEAPSAEVNQEVSPSLSNEPIIVNKPDPSTDNYSPGAITTSPVDEDDLTTEAAEGLVPPTDQLIVQEEQIE